MPRSWRLLDSGVGRGPFNLALDEILFHRAGTGASPPTLRLYRWSPEAISIGYAQRREVCGTGPRVVRRITGGRAVFHGPEITYSVTATRYPELFGTGLRSAYAAISLALSRGLEKLGLRTGVAGDDAAAIPRERHGHPVCFFFTSGHEITLQGKKCVGSAQRRSGAALLQHGSILMDSESPGLRSYLQSISVGSGEEIPMIGIAQVLGDPVPYRDLAEAVASGFEEAWGIRFLRGGASREELELAERLENCKYLNPEWNINGRLDGEAERLAGALSEGRPI